MSTEPRININLNRELRQAIEAALVDQNATLLEISKHGQMVIRDHENNCNIIWHAVDDTDFNPVWDVKLGGITWRFQRNVETTAVHTIIGKTSRGE